MASPRIAVLSGCQMEGLVSALQILFPDSQVEGFHTYRLLGPDRDEIQPRVKAADILLTMPLDPRFGTFATENVASMCRRVQLVPQIVFPAFHPDIIYIDKADAKYVQSPLTDYNSNIAASAFLLGLGVESTIRLFNAFIYQKMGYFDIYAKCEASLIADFAAHDIDLRGALVSWAEQPGCFMYSTNHPKNFVIADVAIEACRALGLDVPAAFPCADLMPDRLANWVVYPVFPELAARLGKPGHYYFKALSLDKMNVLDLEGFVRRSFELYDRENPSEWIVPERLAASKSTLGSLLGLDAGVRHAVSAASG